MLDFTNCIEELNTYKGSEKKKTLLYDNKRYLVKFPDPIREKNKNISYINNAYSEYIGSHIFDLTGINTQNTVLGIYIYNNKEKIVCGCEDFTSTDNILYEFENLAISTNPDKRIGTELNDILEIIDELKIIENQQVKQKFYDMFIVDAFIGNTDRHNGNWGFLMNKQTNKSIFSPIYDCGSCLNPMLSDEDLIKLNDNEIYNLAVNCYSCLKENDKKINYMNYIKSMKNIECNKSLCRIFPKIDINKISEFINKIECISDIRKEFYIKILNYRYEILYNTYNNAKLQITE